VVKTTRSYESLGLSQYQPVTNGQTNRQTPPIDKSRLQHS